MVSQSRQRSRTPAAKAEPKQQPSSKSGRQMESLSRKGSGSGGSGSGSGPFLAKDSKAKVPTSFQKNDAKDAKSQSLGLLTPFKPGDWARVPPEVRDTIKNEECISLDALFGDSQSVGVGQLIELCLAWFCEDDGGLDLDWYSDADGDTKHGTQKAIEPSKFNRDLQEQTCEEYKHRLLMEGQPQSVAGKRQLL